MNSNLLGSQASLLLASNSNNNSNNSNMFNIFLTLLLSSFVVSFINLVQNNIYLPDLTKYLEHILICLKIKKHEYSIVLKSSTYRNKYGRQYSEITAEKLSVLHDLQMNMQKYKNLYNLKQESYSKYDNYLDEEKRIGYYNPDQFKPIIIFDDKKYYLKIINCEVKKIEKDDKGSVSNNIKTNNLIIKSNKSLRFIKEYIKNCVKNREDFITNKKERYIYTYIGEDEHKQHTWEKELFVPYASFSGLVGDEIKIIEKDFDFFQSESGIKWYKNRFIPYQLTHLYHGIPGTGKSIIASAIASKYNLHIVKILH